MAVRVIDRCCEAAYCFGHRGHMSYCTTVGLHRWQLEPVYTIQPVVKPVEQPVEQRTLSCKQTFNRLSTPVVEPVWQPVVSCKRGITRRLRVNSVDSRHRWRHWWRCSSWRHCWHFVANVVSVSLRSATCPQCSSFISYLTRLRFIATVVVNVNHYSRLVSRILVLLFGPNIVPGT